MHMINDKGEAVYFNPSARTAKTSGSSRASAPPLSWAVTASGARAGPLLSGPRRTATLPGTAFVRADPVFSGGKNTPAKR